MKPAIRPALWPSCLRLATRGFALAAVLILGVTRGSCDAPVVIDMLKVDATELEPPPQTDAQHTPWMRVPPGAHRLQFGFGPPDEQGPPLRLRYRLEGFDATWQEAGGEMRLTLMLLNSEGEVLGFFESPMRGRSEGWTNSLAQSRFTSRQDTVTLPPGTELIRVIFNSGTWDTRYGASHPTVGIAVIDDCRILVRTGGEERNLWPNPAFDEGENLDNPEAAEPRGWTRGGIGRGIARVLTIPGSPQGRALALVDNNPRSGAEWRCDLNVKGLVEPGASVTVEWKELYTVGAAGGHAAEYPFVPPGYYVFNVEAFTPAGEPAGPRAALGVVIPQVFWKTLPFLSVCGLGLAAAVAAAARTVTRRRLRQELAQVELQRTLERERTRIARDIHDDLGTSLTRVALLSHSARDEAPPGSPLAEELDQIGRTSQEMTRTLDEIVWAVDPAHDSLDSIANYLGRFAQDFLAAAGIRCRLDFPMQLPAHPVSAEVRHNLFLAFKEILNNVVRHAGARQVNITLSVTKTNFVLAVADDGKGFVPAPASGGSPPRGGHGLANIRERLAQIGGVGEVLSQPGGGTRVHLQVPFTNNRAAPR